MSKTEEFIIYTEHALRRMSVRNITEQMVIEALSNPEQTGTGYKNRALAYKGFGGKRIKVVYTEEKEKLIIISVMWD
jgi:hypothetical protein